MTAKNIVRKSQDRGLGDHGWLHSRHSFSFADYYDPLHMGFRSLRVINQDKVAPNKGFPKHPHNDMEIFSYVLEGTLSHRDSLGNGRDLKPGQVQLMSAGKGITHSEYNPSSTDPLHFLQIWILPERLGLTPSYTEWHPPTGTDQHGKVLIISRDGRDGSAVIHQDASIYRIRLRSGEKLHHELAAERGLWLQVIHGPIFLDDTRLEPGDGAGSESPAKFDIQAGDASVEALLFDLK